MLHPNIRSNRFNGKDNTTLRGRQHENMWVALIAQNRSDRVRFDQAQMPQNGQERLFKHKILMSALEFLRYG